MLKRMSAGYWREIDNDI